MSETTALTNPTPTDLIERVLITGDLSKLSAQDRVSYYTATCKSLGLNPLTKPFEYITLQGKLVMYARKDATDQLRRNNRVSIVRLERERIEDIYTVTAYARDASGREDSSIGAVSIAGVKGDALANAIMKAETKAKRRVTLSITGLGMLDETEIETIPQESRQPAHAELPAPKPPTHGNDLPPEMTLAEMMDETARILAAPPSPFTPRHFAAVKANWAALIKIARAETVPVQAIKADAKPSEWLKAILELGEAIIAQRSAVEPLPF